jgi:hypothetical protein
MAPSCGSSVHPEVRKTTPRRIRIIGENERGEFENRGISIS